MSDETSKPMDLEATRLFAQDICGALDSILCAHSKYMPNKIRHKICDGLFARIQELEALHTPPAPLAADLTLIDIQMNDIYPHFTGREKEAWDRLHAALQAPAPLHEAAPREIHVEIFGGSFNMEILAAGVRKLDLEPGEYVFREVLPPVQSPSSEGGV